MKNADEMTPEELRKLADKKEAQLVNASKPIPLENPNWNPVVKMCQELVDDFAKPVEDREVYDNIDHHYMYELVMEAVFGPDIWVWSNGRR